MKDRNRRRTKRNRKGLAIGRVEGLEGRQLLASITEFAIPSGTPRPTYITSGPDGNLWFAEQNAAKIGRITPAGTVTEFGLPANSLPLSITKGPDGNLWFTDTGNNSIGRITPIGTVTEFAVPTANSGPSGITTGPDGALWFGEATGNQIGRITTSGSFTEFDGAGSISSPSEVVTGSDGNIWFTENGDMVGKIVPSGATQGATTLYATSAGSTPRGITLGSDGNIWFTESGNNNVGRITPAGTLTEFGITAGSDYPSEITSRPNGNLYISEDTSNTIVEITTAGTVVTQFSIPTPDSSPDGITVGPDGNIWFVEYIGDQVGRLDESSASTLSISSATGTYGGTTNLSATLTSASVPVPGETVDFHMGAVDVGTAITNGAGIATLDNVPLGALGAGGHVGYVTATFSGDASYSNTSSTADLTVTPAPLTIAASDQTKVYGAALPTLTASYTGFVNGDTSASLTTAPTLTTTATAASHVAGSPYAITASGAIDGNYAISYVSGTLSVTLASLTITADAKSKVYGQPNPTFTASETGFVLGDNASVLGGDLGFGTPATVASGVGVYPITPSGVVSTDYAITYQPSNLEVTPAALLLTLLDANKVYGQVVPTLIGFYSGFANGDTPASLTTPAIISTVALSSSHVGSYPITASGATATNYTIGYADGTLTVTPATLIVTPDNVVKPIGLAIPALTASYSGFVNGDTPASLTSPVSLATTATSGSGFGSYPITVSGGASPDYIIVDGQGTLTVPTDAAGAAFLTAVYQQVLGRNPETFGLDSWLVALDDGASQASVVERIYESPEAVAYRADHSIAFDLDAPGRIALVTALYEDVLARSPEPTGLAGWLARLDVGVSPAQVAAEIYGSAEAIADRAASPAPAPPTRAVEIDLVIALYDDMLDRSPEPTGLASWLARLDGGENAAQVAAEIYGSAEAIAKRNA